MNTGGWKVGQSIMLELSFGLGTGPDKVLEPFVQEGYNLWTEKWQALWGSLWNPSALIAHLAVLSDTVTEVDYSKATLAARKLTLDKALTKAQDLATMIGVNIDGSQLSKAELFVALSVATRIQAHLHNGFNWNPEIDFADKTRQQYTQLIRILREGDLHEHFWHLIEQFYFEFYKSWRFTKNKQVEELECYVISKVGCAESDVGYPDIDWVIPMHPLRYSKVLEQQISEKYKIFFWIDPFNLTDAMSIRANMFIVSCNVHILKYREFEEEIDFLTSRIKAISDPTRIKILHMIRFFSMDNTQMANFLQIARPTVSVHTKILREAGLIESYADGRSMRHRLLLKAVDELVLDIDKYINFSINSKREG